MYKRAMERLSPGDRVWVNASPRGFVGVGRVIGRAQPAASFKVTASDGRQISILDAPTHGNYRREFVSNKESCEYFLPMKWLQTVTEDRAFHEIGFFGNPAPIYRGQSERWLATLDRLKEEFPNFDEPAL